MTLLKVSDNYSAVIVGNFSASATTITVDVAPVKTAGYLTIFDLNGNQLEKIKYTGVSGLDLTGCIRGLSFDDNSDTPVVGNAKPLSNSMVIAMTVTQHYVNPVIDFVNQYNGKWMEAVADFAALEALVDPADGEVRVTLDDSKLYVYDLDTTTWVLAGAGGGAGTVYRTTLLGTESTGDDNKTFTLTSGSFPDKKYFQVYKNGVLMGEGATNDYVATGSNQAVFNDEVEDDDVIDLLVISVDLYNPAWGLVDSDVLPDLTDTHDIGSTAKKFKDAHFSGAVSAGSFSGDGSNLDDGANGKLKSGTAANELVRLDGSAKLPAVDGSNLTNLPPQSNFQILGKLTKGSVTMSNITTAADTDGTIFLAYNAPASANNIIIIFRLAKDSVTGNYKMTHSFQSAISGNSYWGTPSMTVMGDYLYYSRSNSADIYRVDKATLANEATISFSGGNPDTNVKYLFNDGTFVYVYNRTGSYYIKKYSVSGSTFTFISQITSSAAGGSTGGTWLDATNFYVAQQNGTIYIINRTTGTVSNSSDTPPKVEILAAATKTDQRVGTRMLSITSNNTASSDNYAIVYLDWYSSTNF